MDLRVPPRRNVMGRFARPLLPFALIAAFAAVARAQHAPVPAQPPPGYFTPTPATPSSPTWLRPRLSALSSDGAASTYTDFVGQPINNYANPPDPHGAAGPVGILTITNSGVRYLQKNGTPYWEQPQLEDCFKSLVPGYSSALVDTRALYDHVAERFYMMALEVPFTFLPGKPLSTDCQAFVHLAVSKSSHPLSVTEADWYFYRIEVTEISGGYAYGMDYPGFGFDDTSIYITGNMVALPVNVLGWPRRSQIRIVDKALALVGVASTDSVLTPLAGNPFDSGYTLQPVTVMSAASPGPVAYFAEVRYTGPSDQIRLWAVSGPPRARTLDAAALTVPNYGSPAFAPQCSTSYRLDTQGRKAMGNAFWYDGSLWFCYTGSVGATSAVFYDRILTNGFPAAQPMVAESGSITGSGGAWTYQPAIGCNRLGDIGLVYTQSDAVSCPSILYTTRRRDATAFEEPQVLKTSDTWKRVNPADGDRVRWGDYATVTGDPYDESLWISHECLPPFVPSAKPYVEWQTWWGNLRFPAGASGWPTDGLVVRTGQVPVDRVILARGPAGASYYVTEEQRTGLAAIYVTQRASDGSVPAGWNEDGLRLAPGINMPMSLLEAVPDGAGGVYVVWDQSGLRAQRLDATGSVAAGWPSAGLPLAGSASSAAIVADGAGGLLLAARSGGLWVQHLSPSGAKLWGASGVTVSSLGGAPTLCDDGAGGAIVVWQQSGLRAQRVSAAGTALWTAGGQTLGAGSQPTVVADGAGGASILYVTASGGLNALRIDGGGVVAPGWPSQGVVVCAPSSAPAERVLVTDGAGGLVAGWVDQRDPLDPGNLYAVRLTGSGTRAPGWTENGSVVCAAAGSQSGLRMVADGAGGALFTWLDQRGGPAVYAHHLLGDGSHNSAFPSDGLPIANASDELLDPGLAVTSERTVTLVWRQVPDVAPEVPASNSVRARAVAFDPLPPAAVTDLRLAAGSANLLAHWTLAGDDGASGTAAAYELRYATFPIDESNLLQASARGGALSDRAGTAFCASIEPLARCQEFHVVVRTRDAAGNWSALSNQATIRTNCSGSTLAECAPQSLGVRPGEAGAPLTVELAVPYPNPAHATSRIVLGMPEDRAGDQLELGVFDVAGRRIVALARGPARSGYTTLTWDLRDEAGRAVPRGVYFVRLQVGTSRWTRTVIVN